MDELIDILDADGNHTGKQCLKSVAHEKGFYHETVHVWFYTQDGKVLLQKRGPEKETFPNLWDVSVAGHIQSKEPVLEAALREIDEELGLQIQKEDLTKIAFRKAEKTHPNGIQDNEFFHVFLAELKVDVSQLQKQEEEVADVALFDLSILKGTKEVSLVPNFDHYFEFIFSEISSTLL